jgi:hypothetical protein
MFLHMANQLDLILQTHVPHRPWNGSRLTILPFAPYTLFSWEKNAQMYCLFFFPGSGSEFSKQRRHHSLTYGCMVTCPDHIHVENCAAKHTSHFACTSRIHQIRKNMKHS